MTDFEREEQEIIGRLEGYQNADVTTALYKLGSMLVKESIERTARVESKARTLAGFVGAVLALLLSTFSSWRNEVEQLKAAALLILISVFLLVVAGAFAIVALQTRSYQWFDWKDGWFADEYFGDADQLKKYYLIAMYRTVASHEKINGEKASRVFYAEVLAFVGGVTIAAPLVAVLWRIVWLNS